MSKNSSGSPDDRDEASKSASSGGRSPTERDESASVSRSAGGGGSAAGGTKGGSNGNSSGGGFGSALGGGGGTADSMRSVGSESGPGRSGFGTTDKSVNAGLSPTERAEASAAAATSRGLGTVMDSRTQAANSMLSAGVTSIGGKMATTSPMSPTDVYGQAANSLRGSGVTTIGGAPAMSGGPSFREAENKTMAKYDAMDGALSTIRPLEGGVKDPYNSLVFGRPGFKTPNRADLTDMTIAEVQDYQAGMLKSGHKTTAVGAYQMIRSTLGEATAALGLDPATTRFTPAVQDRLALQLMDGRAARSKNADGTVDPDRLARNLSNEWTSLKGRPTTAKNMANDLVANEIVGPAPEGMTSTKVSKTYQDPQVSTDARDKKATPTKSVESFTQKYLAPKAPASDASAKPDRSLGQKIAAGAIDVGAGLIPGIGTAAGLVNAGLAVTGNRTIGQRVVDEIGSGTAKPAGPIDWNQGGNSGGTDRTPVKDAPTSVEPPPAAAPASAPVTEQVASFVSKYIRRPTPAEKWGRGLGVRA